VEIARRKERLREELGPRRRQVSEAAAEMAGRAIAATWVELPDFGSCRRLALYSAVRGEVATGGLLQLAELRGLRVLWPRVDDDRLVFVEAELRELTRGAFGIPEPPATRGGSLLAAGDWVAVPGVAFDAAGRRLGRGGGFYDRALAHCPESVRVGVGYDFQCIDEVPAGPLDQPMDWVVTDERVLAVRRGAREEP